MKFIMKSGLFGAFWGLIYSFVSFYLFTPYARINIFFLPAFIIQGTILGVAYGLLELTPINNFNLLRGILAGLVSALPNIFITITNAFIVNKFYGNDAVRKEIIIAILLFSIGSIIAGIVVSKLIVYSKKNGTLPNVPGLE